MNTQVGVDFFIAWKRSQGLQFETGAKTLRAFSRFADNPELQELSPSVVSQFLARTKTSTLTFIGKHSVLRDFFEYCAMRRMMPVLSLPPAPARPRPTFVPHVYTRNEIKRLLKAVRGNQGHGLASLDERTFRMALLLLYGTGMRVGELVSLKDGDVDLKKGLVTVGRKRSCSRRTIPLCEDLVQLARSYSGFKARKRMKCGSFLATKTDRVIGQCTLGRCFRRLLLRADFLGSPQVDSQPRLQDLRPSFAVHRITSWIKSRKDLNRMLPALSAYMGLSGLGSTERYLTLAPERFRKELNVLSPNQKRMPWKKDLALMNFLKAL
jgi:integrase/recombinase XerD